MTKGIKAPGAPIRKKTAIILSGGRSSRMGVNKAMLELNGKPLIEIMLDKVLAFDEILVSTNTMDEYAYLEERGVRLVKDIIPHQGPLSGIHAGLSCADAECAAVLPCDMPLVPAALVRYLSEIADRSDGFDAVVPVTERAYQPLCAVYRKTCIGFIEKNLAKGINKASAMLSCVRVREVGGAEMARFGDIHDMFRNVNDFESFAGLRA
ncbi:MAG: molybdenum cofactor guanylyltransferase [Clostridiales Family XIII bacterium]|nr:molybdenum cofactor guanylyltransferase [Clostridiales Family XIII bacterium]